MASIGDAVALADALVRTYRTMQERFANASTNPQLVTDLAHHFDNLHLRADRVNTVCRQNSMQLSDSLAAELQHRLHAFRTDIEAIHGELQHMDTRLQKRSFRFGRAKTVRAWLSEQGARATALEAELSRMADLLVKAEGVARIGNAVENITSTTAREQQDHFTPCFDVPSNPPHVVLDFGAPRGQGDDVQISLEGKLKHAILRADGTRSIAAFGSNLNSTVGMVGMSGVGKSCALRGLARDHDIRQRFCDGVYWLVLGMDATEAEIVQQLAGIAKQSGGVRIAKEVLDQKSILGAVLEVKRWFSRKRILLLIDDVWQKRDLPRDIVELLGQLADNEAGSRVSFTTRDLGVVGQSEAIEFNARNVDISQQILLSAAGMQVEDVHTLDGLLQDLLQLCGGLPMALSVAGSAIVLRRRVADTLSPKEIIEEYLAVLRTYRERLLNGTVVQDGYQNLSSAFEASLMMLNEQVTPVSYRMSFQEMYQCLAVIERQGWLPLHVLMVLWECQNQVDAIDILNNFAMASLAERKDLILNGKKVPGIVLHDLQLDYVKAGCKASGLIQNLHKKLVVEWTTHKERTDGTPDCPSGFLDIARKEVYLDEYVRNNLSRHLIGARMNVEMQRLMRDPRWTASRLVSSEVLGLEVDYKKFLDRNGQELATKVGTSEWAIQMIVRAARLCSPYVLRNAEEVWFQMYGRLFNIPQESALLQEYLRDIERYAKKPWIKTLSPTLSNPGFLLNIYVCTGSVHEIAVAEGGRAILALGACQEEAFVITFAKGEAESRVVLKGNDEKVRWIRCSKTGNLAVTGHADGAVQFWDRTTGRTIGTAHQLQSDDNFRLGVTADGKKVAFAGRDNFLRILNVETGQPVEKPKLRQKERIFVIAWSPDGKRVASAGKGSTVMILDTETGSVVESLGSGHKGTVLCLAWSPDGTRVSSGGRDKIIRIWDAGTGEAVGKPLDGHSSDVFCISWSSDGKKLASSGWDRTIRIWNVIAGLQIGAPLEGHTNTVSCLAWFADGRRLASGSWDETVRVWDTETERTVNTAVRRHSKKIVHVEWSPDGTLVASAACDREVKVWDGKTGQLVGSLSQGKHKVISCLSWSPDGVLLASGRGDKRLMLWNVKSGEVVGESIRGHNERIDRIWWSSDSTQLLSVSEHEKRVWEVSGKNAIEEVKDISFDDFCVRESSQAREPILSLRDTGLLYRSGDELIRLGTLERSGLSLRHSGSGSKYLAFSNRRFYFFELVE